MTKYIGWVPTVGGRLSYSIIGDSNHPSLAETANVADSNKRQILCLQKRNLLDSSFPIFKTAFANLFWNISGSFYFFLNAESSNSFSSLDQSIRGKLYLFHKESHITRNTLKCIDEIKLAIKELNKFHPSLNTTDLSQFYSTEVQDHLKNIDTHHFFQRTLS